MIICEKHGIKKSKRLVYDCDCPNCNCHHFEFYCKECEEEKHIRNIEIIGNNRRMINDILNDECFIKEEIGMDYKIMFGDRYKIIPFEMIQFGRLNEVTNIIKKLTNQE